MNKNIKKLSNNPHYIMSEKELEELANMLASEAKDEKKQEKVMLNKNRVKKDFVQLEKTPALTEVDDGYSE